MPGSWVRVPPLLYERPSNRMAFFILVLCANLSQRERRPVGAAGHRSIDLRRRTGSRLACCNQRGDRGRGHAGLATDGLIPLQRVAADDETADCIPVANHQLLTEAVVFE